MRLLIAPTRPAERARKQQLSALGRDFVRAARAIFDEFPVVELSQRIVDRTDRASAVYARIPCIRFTTRDMETIYTRTGIRFVDAGGSAGGIKAVHEEKGLFLKFALDQEGYYESATMAAKAAKREAAASSKLMEMESMPICTPLLECVDVPARLRSGGTRVIRVQVFARVDVRSFKEDDMATWESTTLRVGSCDGGKTMHVDDTQSEDVIDELQYQFFLSTYTRKVERRIAHRTLCVERPAVPTDDLDEPLAQPAPMTSQECSLPASGAGLGAPVASSGSSYPAGTSSLPVMDLLSRHGLEAIVLEYIRNAIGECLSEEALDRKRQKPLRVGVLGNDYVAEQAKKAVQSSGFWLDPVARSQQLTRHVVKASGPHAMSLPLPFDVEVHQLDDGRRLVLDTHRLLLPDILWMDWASTHIDAKPRVWILMPGSDKFLVRGTLVDYDL